MLVFPVMRGEISGSYSFFKAKLSYFFITVYFIFHCNCIATTFWKAENKLLDRENVKPFQAPLWFENVRTTVSNFFRRPLPLVEYLLKLVLRPGGTLLNVGKVFVEIVVMNELYYRYFSRWTLFIILHVCSKLVWTLEIRKLKSHFKGLQISKHHYVFRTAYSHSYMYS